MINIEKGETKLYYSSETQLGKKAYASLKDLGKNVLGIDICKTNVPGSHWIEIAERMKVTIKDLINTDHPDFTNTYGNDKMDLKAQDWLLILENHPNTLKFPIILKLNGAGFAQNSSDIKNFMPLDD